MNFKRTLCCLVLCQGVAATMWGCHSNEPADAQKKQAFIGKPNQKFDPATIPPEYKAGFEKWQKSNGAKVSGPVDNPVNQ